MPHKETCDFNQVDLFLNDELDAEQQSRFSLHLESCDQCRAAIDDSAADARFWKETVKHLGNVRPSSLTGTSDCISGDCEFNPTDSGVVRADHSITTLIQTLLPTDDPEMLGRIGEYEISGIVGVGGMGAVLKGFDKSLMRVVAIKVMSPHLADKGSARKRFEREARAAAAISHDNVCDIYRVDELNGLPYLVMPFARGPSLQKRIDESGPLSTIEVVLVGMQVASGLAAAHEQGLVHRDIKPANILLNDGVERILITDFGVARAMDDASMTQTGLIAGTPQYMSPEQARGELVDHRSDLFSLGALLYTVCTGRPPFRAEAPFGILRKITDTQPRSILEINPEIPAWLVAIIDRLLEKEPSKRFEDAKEVSEIFEKCLAHLRQPNQNNLPRKVIDLPLTLSIATPPKPRKLSASGLVNWLKIAAATFGIAIVAAAGLLWLTQAPDISGSWQGDSWNSISLKSVKEANDWYAGRFIDSAGRKGAIHLEWSRMERRYKGRWSLDANNSGNIVVRQGINGSIRGAIMFDSDVTSSSMGQRLRDFEWRPSESSSTSEFLENTQENRRDHDLTVASQSQVMKIFAPQNGIIRRVAEEIRSGAAVKKSDVILEMGPAPDALKNARNELRSIEVELDSMRAKLAIQQESLNRMSEARDLDIQAAEEKASAARAKLESQHKALASLEAKEKQASSDYERMKQLFDKGLRKKASLDAASAASQTAQADLASAKSNVEALRHELNIKKLEIATADNQGQMRLDSIVKDQQEASLRIASLETYKKELEAALKKSERMTILAPRDGIISRLELGQNQLVKQGELLLEITVSNRADQSDPANSSIAGEVKAQSPTQIGDFNFGSLPELLTFSSTLEKQLRQAGKALNDTVTEIDDLADSIAQQEQALSANEAKVFRLKNSKPKDQRELDKAVSERELRRQSLNTVIEQKAKLLSQQANLQDEYDSAKSQLTTAIKLISSELVSVTEQQKLAKNIADNQRQKHEMGEASILELREAEVRNVELESRVDRLQQLLESLKAVARKQNTVLIK